MSARLTAVLERVLGADIAVLEKVEDFKESEFWDSLRYVDLVVSLQAEFQVKLEKEQIKRLSSVAQVRAVLAQHGIDA